MSREEVLLLLRELFAECDQIVDDIYRREDPEEIEAATRVDRVLKAAVENLLARQK